MEKQQKLRFSPYKQREIGQKRSCFVMRKRHSTDSLCMEKSFHKILEQMLDDESHPQGESASRTSHHQAESEFNFHWNPTYVQRPISFQQTNYPRQRPRPTPQPKSEKVEPLWLLKQLSPALQSDIETLLRLGANELEDGVSIVLLKKCYRRLAKAYHPDSRGQGAKPNSSPETFLKLKSVYDRLLKSLNALSAQACDSECASAQEYQPPNAA